MIDSNWSSHITTPKLLGAMVTIGRMLALEPNSGYGLTQ